MEMLRERIKGLEHKIMEMIRHGQENVAIADRLHRWTRAHPAHRRPGRRCRARCVERCKHEFLIPQAAHPAVGRGRAPTPTRPSRSRPATT